MVCVRIVRIKASSMELLDGCSVASCGVVAMETFFSVTMTMMLMMTAHVMKKMMTRYL